MTLGSPRDFLFAYIEDVFCIQAIKNSMAFIFIIFIFKFWYQPVCIPKLENIGMGYFGIRLFSLLNKAFLDSYKEDTF